MASHLMISSNTPGSAVRAFGGQQAAHQDATTEPGLLGLFGALLANSNAQAGAKAQTGGDLPNGGAEIDLAALLAGLDGAAAESGEGEAEDAEALAAAMGMPTQQLVPVDPKPMVDFVDALGALKASLDRGEPLDPELLAQVQAALDGLAQALGLDLDTLPVPEDFAALLETDAAGGNDLAATLTGLLAPMAASLAGAEADADPTSDRAAIDAQLKSLGDKLGALIAALEQGDVPPEKLTAIGMLGGAPVDEIQDALARFAATTKPDVVVPDTPELAAPALKLSEPVLVGRTVDRTEPPPPAEPVVPPVEEAETSTNRQNAQADLDRPARERPEPARAERAQPATPAAPAEANAAQPAPSASDTARLRVDAAAQRVVQAGYQTSQQQLNLPQIAFELARQVQDGNTRFQIRLDPPELGRIDVRLDIDSTGKVNARLTVEKSETLDLMQRDQRGLERALQQAGLDSGKTNLEFSLKQNPFAGQLGQGDREGREQGGTSQSGNAGAGEDAEQSLPTVSLYRGSLQATGVNIIA